MKKQHFGYRSKRELHIFLFCWMAYFSTYIGRLNFSAVIPELQAEGIWTGTQIASVSSAFFVCYGIGQFLSGVLGDRANTRLMVFLGLFVSALCNIFGFCFTTYPVFFCLWALNGFVQSLVWTPILKIGSMHFDIDTVNKFGVDMSTTVPLGTLCSYGVSLLTLLFLPYRYVFLTCGLLETLAAFSWLFGTKRLLLQTSVDTKEEKSEPQHFQRASAKATLHAMAVSGVLLMMIPIIIQGTLKDSVTQWVPAFFSGQFGSATTFSLALTMLLPIINVTGAYFANALNHKLHNELATAAIFFGVSFVFLAVLKTWGANSMLLSLVCMATVTNCMFAINVLLITLVPLHFTAFGRVSTIGGALNAIAYIGCGILNLAAGKLLEMENGWGNLFSLWILLAGIAVLCSALIYPLWKRFLKENRTY